MGGITGTIRVLHVDDEPDFADMAAAFLERHDDRIDVTTATSAREGLDVLADHEYDCIVSDYDMPGQTGIAFLETVREDYPDLPFVLFTGKGSETVASEAISAGATDYLQKGRGTEQYELLANRIRNVVSQFRNEQRRATLERVRAIVSDVNQTLVRASSREQIETDVCEILAGADPYRLAVVAGVDSDTKRIEPRTWAGEGDAFLDAFEMRVGEDAPGRHAPGGRAFHDREVAVVQNIQSDPDYEPWRDLALEHGFQALAVVPLEYDSDLYGLLAVLADRRQAFDETERELLAELGGDVAHAIHTRKLQADLKASERRFEAVFEDPGMLVGVLDTDGTLRRTNRTSMEFVDADRDAVLGVPFWETPWWSADMRDDVRQWVDRARGGEYVEYEADLVRPDGEPYSVSGAVRPVTDSEGEVVSLVVSARDVTERKQREQQLREEHAFNEVALDTVIDFYWVLDLDGYVTDWGDRDGSVTGYTPDEAIGMHATDLFPERERAYIADKIARLRETGEITAEADFRTNGGELVPYRFDGTVVTDDDGEVQLMCGLGQDVSARRERERKLESLHEATRDLMAADTEQEVAGEAVEAVRDILGMELNACWFYEAAQNALVPVAWTETSDAIVGEPPTYPEGEGLSWDAFETGEVAVYDDVSTRDSRYDPETEIRSEIILPLGEHGVMNIGSLDPDAFDEQDVSLASLYATNVETALNRAAREARLREERAFFDQAVNALDDIFYVVDSTGELLRWNDRVSEVTGYTDGDIVEMDVVDFFAEEDRPRVAEAVATALDTGRASIETDVLTSDGERLPYEFTGSLLTDPDGNRLGLVGIGRDIADRKQHERELEAQNERLEEFASIVSHDLRNPLNVAAGRVDLAAEECDSDHLEAVERAHERMRVLIDNVMTVARDGEQATDIEAVGLADLVAACWQNVETGVATLVTDTDRTIRADRSRLQQLLENLVRNAVDHGGADVTVTVGDLPGGFYVADDGPGVPPDARDKVFETGYSTSGDGAGFGLPIVEEIVDAHGWEVRVTDGEAGGARFEVTGVEFAG